MIQNR
ncbi:hypothetical protein D046_7387A, partial [Vibrio parahaemolyticus V-223/04]